MKGFRGYVEKYGLPLSVYSDRHATYKCNRSGRATAKPTIEDDLAGREPMSQFHRALEGLGVQVIHARSPQWRGHCEAKGRVERVFRMFQDRPAVAAPLIKEMRLAGICTIEEGNRFLETYLQITTSAFA